MGRLSDDYACVTRGRGTHMTIGAILKDALRALLPLLLLLIACFAAGFFLGRATAPKAVGPPGLSTLPPPPGWSDHGPELRSERGPDVSGEVYR